MSTESNGKAEVSSTCGGEPTTPSAPPAKSKKGPTKKKSRSSGKRNRDICDIFGEAAMTNVYNISHNVQDMLYFRGFTWVEKKAK